MQLLWGYDDD